jgi:ribosomal protein S12 methylthiotransferase
MRRQQRIAAELQRARIGHDVRVLVDGPSAEHELVLQGRVEGQAPDIDPVVYLTDVDTTVVRPGDLIRARDIAVNGYDLVAAPSQRN